MNEPSIFSRIVKGEIPCHKIYEDQQTLAFLDIHPVQPGHTLVIPKVQVDRLEDLPQDEYVVLMTSVKKVMERLVAVFGPGYRACLKVEGFDVAHAHVHIIPCQSGEDFRAELGVTQEPDHASLAAMAKKLAF